MRRGLRAVPALLASAAALLALGALSRVPYSEPGADAAVIRLSWRVPGLRVEECRRPSAEELERLPAHMRRPEICERRIAPYRLRVALDGEQVEDAEVRAAGAREDRPLYVFRELSVSPGRHRLEVEFRPQGLPAAETADAERASVVELEMEAELELAPGRVALVTYDPDGRALVLR